MTLLQNKLIDRSKLINRFQTIVGTIKWRITHTRAWIWRRVLRKTTVVAVVGSCGKTTTKELISACLREAGGTAKNLGNWGGLRFGGIANAILNTRPGDRFLVIEAGIEKPGDMGRIGKLLRPDVVVVTRVAPAHTAYFENLDHIAREKGIMLEYCRRNGLVVLNRDDDRVYAMRNRTGEQVVTYGVHPDADIRCQHKHSTWPERLSLLVEHKGTSVRVNSKLVGEHWSEAILAAIAASHSLGVPLASCAEVIGQLEPVWARMQPVELPSGVVFIRDDFHGSPHNYETAFEVMRSAVAARKMLVTSGYSDAVGHSRDSIRALAEKAYGIFDVFVFFGQNSRFAARLLKEKGIDPERVMATNNIHEIVDFLKQNLASGDLVLLKGRTSAHISRAYLGLIGELACDLQTCGNQFLCDRCPKLGFAWREDLRAYMASPDSYL